MVDLCPNCKQPKAGGKSGSLTQWIFVCHCDSLKSEESASDAESYKFQICRTCRKRVNTGREGSLTQFVFRSDSCRCEFPELVDVAVARATEAGSEFANDAKSLQERIDEIEGIELSPDSFPTNRFKPIREIGRGASGAVFLCIDRLLGNNVAVKTLHYLAADQLLGFQQEARAISKLTHPNIVKILDFGATDGGTPYMVLEFIDGVDLETLVARSGQLSLVKSLEVMLSVCDALSYSHLKEIYHRDLKPSNILIEESAQGLNAKLVDFGVARIKFETQEPTVCHGTTVIGTPAYMSPDQMRGISYDQRSELYSIGCILFELLAGKQLYNAETVLELVALHANAPIPKLSDVADGAEYPAELDRILARCLAKLPEDRYQSVHALKTDLTKVLELEQQGNKALAAETTDHDEPLGVRIDHRTLSEVSRQSTKKNKIAIFAVSAVVASVALASTYFVLNPNQNRSEIYAPPSDNTPAPKSKISELGNSLMETKFNINEFNGKKWLFNMGEISDRSVDELLRSKHSDRLWIDQGSLSPAAFLRLEPVHLVSLALINMPVTDAHLDALAKLKTIKLLRLLENPGLDNECLRHIQPMDNLTELHIKNAHITDRGVRYLAGMNNLEILSLDRSLHVSDKSLDVIEGLTSLKRLSLAATKVSKQGILRIAKLKKLHTISVSKLPCDSECITELIKLPLRNLSVRYTPLTTKDLMRLSKLKDLKLLDVRNCDEITKNDQKRFVANRLLLKLPECRLIRERKVGVESFGEMVYDGLDDENMWVN